MVFKGKHGVIYKRIAVFMFNDSDGVQNITVKRIYCFVLPVGTSQCFLSLCLCNLP